ncbi:hypothetical protein [Sediminicoccus sp. KRV36]|uniref:hypothetical protein n=1 Tax=Sediminicoccus sp. KRV36 TaxID=3133721 RepID=UPI00200DDD3C|nr:hypothetical protein [Sediminicoccus rosea]UPY38128.1 hypothetical protein LHU95_05370 [Sediminicoccus rosea]
MFESAYAPGALVVGADEIGIACRFKAGPFARSTDEGGHADAILPRGEPIGYYARTRRDGRLAVIAPGMVRDAAALLRDRPHYMRAALARQRLCPTTFCILRVGESRAADFVAIWREIAERPPLFLAIGGNCAQVIAAALIRIGAMPRPWIRPGSPDALFRALQAAQPQARVAVGFAEFQPSPAGGHNIRLEG